MPRPAPSDLLMRLEPTPFRRWLGTGLLAMMAAVMAVAALQMEADSRLMPRFIAAGLALFGAVQAVRLWQASAGAIELREDGLHCTRTGRRLAAMEEMARVDTGALLIKPASGFVVRLTHKQPFARSTGMWWIWGDKLGIGGVTPKAQGKAMASALGELLRLRDLSDEELEIFAPERAAARRAARARQDG